MNSKSLMQKYASCSGQCINFEKSLIFFGSNVDRGNWEMIENVLGFRTSKF